MSHAPLVELVETPGSPLTTGFDELNQQGAIR